MEARAITQIKIIESRESITAYKDGRGIGGASVSEYVQRSGPGRRSKWGVNVNFSDRGGYGYTKAEARSKLKSLIKREFGAVKFMTEQRHKSLKPGAGKG